MDTPRSAPMPAYLHGIQLPSFRDDTLRYALYFLSSYVVLSQAVNAAFRLYQARRTKAASASSTPDDEAAQQRMERLRTHLPSYLLSTVHAVVQVRRGVRHLLVLFRAPIFLKLHNPLVFGAYGDFPPGASYLARYVREGSSVHQSNSMLVAYLLVDAVAMAAHWPHLGGPDMLLHHAAFLYCALVGGLLHLNVFMFTWLILAEVSTPFLNIRWLMLQLGMAGSPAFTVVQVLFALAFFASRVCLYAVGMLYQAEIIPQCPPYIPRWTAYSTFAVVIVGFLLNLAWFYKIAARAFRPRRSTTDSAQKKQR